jgi:hypothetical protein
LSRALKASAAVLAMSCALGADTPDHPTLGATDCAALIAEAAGHPSFRGAEAISRDRWHGRPPEDPATRHWADGVIRAILQALKSTF